MKILENIKIYNLKTAIDSIDYSYFKESNKSNIELAVKLGSQPIGLGHDSFLKGILVTGDLTCTQYFDHEIQRYHFFDIVMSQSIMHIYPKLKKCARESTKEDFDKIYPQFSLVYEILRSSDDIDEFRSMIPEGVKLKKSIVTNYLQLKTMYYQRNQHKLKEWRDFCEIISDFPILDNILKKTNIDHQLKDYIVWR